MRPNPTATRQHAQNARNTAYSAATSRWMSYLARLGYAVKGVVYVIIGWLAIELAIGHGGKTTDQRGALQTIAAQPFGKVLLVITAIGLLGYALWSLIQAIFDTEGKGTKAKGIISRIGYAIVGIAYGLLAYGAYRLVAGAGSAGQSSTTSTQDWTAKLLDLPPGVALVVILGLIVIGVALYMFYRAYKAEFRRYLNFGRTSMRVRDTIVNLGRWGYGALGVVFGIIGIFLIVAALQHNPGQAKGLDSALSTLSSQQPFGTILLIVVALGLIAYGLYSFAEARFRRIGRA